MYCDNFKLWDKIKFQHEVVEVKPNYDYDLTGKWIVSVINCKISERSESVFDGVMVCIGHHFTPRTPTFKDQNVFKGISFKFNIHTLNYKLNFQVKLFIHNNLRTEKNTKIK